MASVFMSEAGRVLVPGTRFVLHTNSIYTTGGSFDLGHFHSENYFVPDVPRFIFFFCRQPSLMGGETGLVNTAKVFQSLPAETKARLREKAYLAGSYPVDDVRTRYGLSEAGLHQLVRERGLAVERHGDKRHVNLYKPSVLIHPQTGEAALAINYYSGLMRHGFRAAIQRAFMPDYAGPQWALHRQLWQRPALSRLMPSLAVVRAPGVAARNFLGMVQDRAKAKLGLDRDVEAQAPAEVDSAFEADDGARVAQAIRANFSSFRWQAGDMLMIDNLKMAHAGMPGFGPRLLRAMICNPMSLPLSASGPGEWSVPSAAACEVTGGQISRAA
jgi:alpha-ketoglutarate-dependent taurine dioxygenase